MSPAYDAHETPRDLCEQETHSHNLKELKITSLKSSGGRCESGNMFSVLINKSCVVSVLMLAVDFITRPPLVKSGFIT